MFLSLSSLISLFFFFSSLLIDSLSFSPVDCGGGYRIMDHGLRISVADRGSWFWIFRSRYYCFQGVLVNIIPMNFLFSKDKAESLDRSSLLLRLKLGLVRRRIGWMKEWVVAVMGGLVGFGYGGWDDVLWVAGFWLWWLWWWVVMASLVGFMKACSGVLFLPEGL